MTVSDEQFPLVAPAPVHRRDLGSKLEDYLRDEVRELWIVDLVEQCVLVYRHGELVARRARGQAAHISAELVPEVSVDVDEVFRTARLPE